ncbi:hypothetical protein BRADI_1g64155v3 [Brachypodium distachyon]|uniref:Uncharacterized protein n=1 Tax=Brachypodium distachyon TaxID=15368 RepID=A0A0Q3HHE7_BRADI|nr:hypothetical protein BRADI_1g64155v3 [Brachypodium distachyon]PNT77525.1 hypothetical protein BRADI_1g64155v3 [Brachypodium distachyon]
MPPAPSAHTTQAKQSKSTSSGPQPQLPIYAALPAAPTHLITSSPKEPLNRTAARGGRRWRRAARASAVLRWRGPTLRQPTLAGRRSSSSAKKSSALSARVADENLTDSSSREHPPR